MRIRFSPRGGSGGQRWHLCYSWWGRLFVFDGVRCSYHTGRETPEGPCCISLERQTCICTNTESAFAWRWWVHTFTDSTVHRGAAMGQWGGSVDFCGAWGIDDTSVPCLSENVWLTSTHKPDLWCFLGGFLPWNSSLKEKYRTPLEKQQQYLSLPSQKGTAGCGLRRSRPWCWACTRCTAWGTGSRRGRRTPCPLWGSHWSPGRVRCSASRLSSRWTPPSGSCCPLASLSGWDPSSPGLTWRQNHYIE